MWSHFKPRHLRWVLPVVVLALGVSCSGNPSTPSAPAVSSASTTTVPPTAPAPVGAGALSVKITDSPFTDATALLITFSEVSAHMSGGDWVTLPFADGGNTRTCDLKRLLGAEDVLGTGPLAVGHYTQLRLTVSSAKVYFTKATTGSVCAASLTVPDGPEAGMSVDVPSGTLHLNREFDVSTATTTMILLDFDGDKSMHQTGNGKYMMSPVIKVVSVQ
jgi:hypothetical protein